MRKLIVLLPFLISSLVSAEPFEVVSTDGDISHIAVPARTMAAATQVSDVRGSTPFDALAEFVFAPGGPDWYVMRNAGMFQYTSPSEAARPMANRPTTLAAPIASEANRRILREQGVRVFVARAYRAIGQLAPDDVSVGRTNLLAHARARGLDVVPVPEYWAGPDDALWIVLRVED